MQLYFTMPKPGETIREGSIVKWLKNIDENLEEKNPLVELETEKAVFTAESPFRGKLKQILVKENESVKVGTPLALFEVSEEDGEKYLMLGVGVPADKKEEIKFEVDEITEVEKEDRSASPSHFQVSYSPFIRKLAREHDLDDKDLEKIPRKKTGERLTKEDILEYLQQNKNRTSSDLRPSSPRREGEYELIPVTPIRHRIAEHLKKSHLEIPQAATSVDVDMTSIMKFRKEKNLKSFSPFHFFAYAVREILKKNPLFNSHYVEESEKAFIQKYKNIHLAFAVATKQGLFNPVIQKSGDLKFEDLVSKISELESKAKEGKLSIDELTGGTFLINNPGALGGSRSYQLIPHPLVAIIGLNKIQKKPWVVNDQIVPRDITAVDLSFDHRVLDGAEAIQFAEEVKKLLENFPFEIIS